MTTDESERRYPLRMPPDWEPPVPAFTSEFADRRTQVSMVVLGCQFDAADRDPALTAVQDFLRQMKEHGRASHADLAACERDRAGRQQLVATGYWFDGEAADAFLNDSEFAGLWSSYRDRPPRYGVFREVFNVPLTRHETLHSGADHVVGIASVRDGVTDPVRRHAYWGSMRDRLAESATDRFEPSGGVTAIERTASRVVVRANRNLAIIRSGQDLGNASGREREEYFGDVEPNLVAGMDFLRDRGREIGCYDCRFMRFLDADGAPLDHTYGFAYFRSLQDLEAWAEHHPTHKAIFGAFMAFAPGYGPDMRMRLWHEVAVVPAGDQHAEYVNCAPETGFLSGL